MKSGIYSITNIIDNKIYIGSSLNIKGRFASHRSHLKHNKHGNVYLQRAYNKYGISNLKFSILENCKEEDLGIKEKYYCDLYNCNCKDTGYNLAIVSENRILKVSKESYEKAVITRRNNGSYVVTQETRDKISKANIGKPGALKGKHHSEQSRRNISEGRKGIKLSQETKDKISKKLKFRQFSDDHKRKIGEKSKINLILNKLVCPHCNMENNTLNHYKYHGEKCKLKQVAI